MLAKQVGNAVSDGGVHDLFVAVLAEEGDDGTPPETLARDAPVGAVLYHAGDPLFPPRGNELHIGEILDRRFTQPRLVHRDEPLRRRAEDDRGVAAPAVRIAVGDGFARLVE